jgi:hypothetical protein
VPFDTEASVIHAHLLGLLAPFLSPFYVSSLLKPGGRKKQSQYNIYMTCVVLLVQQTWTQTYRFHFYYVQNLQNITKPGQQSQYSDYAIGWTIWGSEPGRGKRVIDFLTHSDRIWEQLASYSRVLGALSLGQCGRCIGITSHHYPLPRLRMSGAIQPPPSHAFTARTGTTLPSFSLHILFSIFIYTN